MKSDVGLTVLAHKTMLKERSALMDDAGESRNDNGKAVVEENDGEKAQSTKAQAGKDFAKFVSCRHEQLKSKNCLACCNSGKTSGGSLKLVFCSECQRECGSSRSCTNCCTSDDQKTVVEACKECDYFAG